MIIKRILVISSFLAFSYSNEIVDIYNFEDNKFNNIIFNLESHNRTAYILNPINTNIFEDIESYGFKINGTYKYPIYNIIPRKVYFDIYSNESLSQISFYQDHSNYFYDTNIAMNSFIRDNINILTLVESKSIEKENYTKKILVSLNKLLDKTKLEIGYMYHYESIPTYYTSNFDYNRVLESFNGKLLFSYDGLKIKVNNRFNFETSNTDRYNYSTINFQAQTHWNDLDIKYIINDKVSFDVFSEYKYTVSNDNSYNSYNKILVKADYLIDKHLISAGNILLDNKNNLYANYIYSNKNYTIFLSIDKNMFLNIASDNNNIISIYNNEQKIGFTYNNDYISSKGIFGRNSNNLNKEYFYYVISNEVKYKWLSARLHYVKNNSKELFINHSSKLNLTLSPIFKNKKFRIYVAGNLNRLGINQGFGYSQNNLDFINEDSSNLDSSVISILDGEFGIIFKYFKISFIKENMYEKYYQYSTNNIIPNSSNYLVNITWLFKD